MKYIFSLFLAFFFSLHVASAALEESFVSSLYKDLEENMDTEVAKRVAALLGVTPEDIITFAKSGSAPGLSGVCCSPAEGESSENPSCTITISKKINCSDQILKMIVQERAFVNEEYYGFQMASAFARWWDGRMTSTKDDIDIQADINAIDRQFFGKEADIEPKGSEVSRTTREEFLFAASDYHIPSSESFSFSAGAGCGGGQASLYGGLVCLPEFCTDFICVNITAIPGRRAVTIPGAKKDSSLANIVYDLEGLAQWLNNLYGLTPTVNKNESFKLSHIFFQMLSSFSFEIYKKRPPIIAEFIGADGGGLKQVAEFSSTPEGGYAWQDTSSSSASTPTSSAAQGESSSGDEEETEESKKKAEIYQELWRLRRSLEACAGGETCTHRQVLESISEDCGLGLSQGGQQERPKAIEKCSRDMATKLRDLEKEEERRRNLQVQKMKQQYYQDVPRYLDALWASVTEFETALYLNQCYVKQAISSCGTEKYDCLSGSP